MSNANNSTNKKVHRSVACLRLPLSISLLITYVQGILKAMTGNATFPTPIPALTAVSNAVGDLQSAETVALTKVKGSIATRNEKKAALVALLELLRAYVQSIADGAPENGPSIIESAGLAVRKTTAPAPRVFAAKPGTVSGTAKLVVPSAARRASYEWQYSIDGGKTWIDAGPTLQARTTVVGLTAGATVLFRYRWVLKGGAGDWSPSVSMLVH